MYGDRRVARIARAARSTNSWSIASTHRAHRADCVLRDTSGIIEQPLFARLNRISAGQGDRHWAI